MAQELAEDQVDWLEGYVTGVNQVSREGDLASGLDGSSIEAWLDSYCRAHPLDKVSDAAAALIEELRHRQR